MTKQTDIEKLYTKIPKSKCKDGCTLCCHDIIQITPEEEERMGGYKWAGKCNHLTENGCSVHENRAFICRLFGTSSVMQCDDCVPEYYLSKEETDELIKEYNRLRIAASS